MEVKNRRDFLSKYFFDQQFELGSVIEFALRLWLGYILISNSIVGTLVKLEDLGMPDHIYRIIKGMWDTGYMMHLVKLVELLAGILIVCNVFVPLALMALVPVVVNIYGMHLFLFHSIFTNGLRNFSG